ncbi:MAG: ATP-binding protein [Myxococcota bacterium]
MRIGLGLRGQLVVALSVAFIAAFALLGVTAVQLGRRSQAAERAREGAALARTFDAALGGEPRYDTFVRVADALLSEGRVRGVELLREPAEGLAAEPWSRGITGLGPQVEAGRVQLTLRPDAAPAAPFGDLLLLYVAVTGGAILLVTTLVLTVLIVRPLESLTRASERVAGGNLDVEVPARGAAEVRRLAASFTGMARQLRADRQALEDRLRELEATTAELGEAEAQILRSARLASVGRLAAGVAHEIGNPLSAILGLVELARDEDMGAAERGELLVRTQRETERIHRIIRELLDFARQGGPSDEDDALGSEVSDLAEVVRDAVRLVAPQQRNVPVRVELEDSLPPVRGSADRLTQVLLNLLLNAVDAVREAGRGEVRLRATRAPGEGVMLVVEDDGPGIPEALRDSIFEPFVTSKATGEGTGLGLAVTHTILERLGGSIDVENIAGAGARFRVHLPPPKPPTVRPPPMR